MTHTEIQYKIDSLESSLESLIVAYNGWLTHEDGDRKQKEITSIIKSIRSKTALKDQFTEQLNQELCQTKK